AVSQDRRISRRTHLAGSRVRRRRAIPGDTSDQRALRPRRTGTLAGRGRASGGRTALTREHPTVLLVEDDPGDVLLVREALADHRAGRHLSVVNDGVEAMEYVRREGDYAASSRPGLVLLDLN